MENVEKQKPDAESPQFLFIKAQKSQAISINAKLLIYKKTPQNMHIAELVSSSITMQSMQTPLQTHLSSVLWADPSQH